MGGSDERAEGACGRERVHEVARDGALLISIKLVAEAGERAAERVATLGVLIERLDLLGQRRDHVVQERARPCDKLCVCVCVWQHKGQVTVVLGVCELWRHTGSSVLGA